ncbi:MAG: ABC transporter permease subunit [Verrucomicrobiae bacterium]|nr:ABC transporter permease subunit [Verrucomicrobiae bacterium]MCP5538646.1 ABC transporter permease subunit [Akkermansiaceae bacterium]MCP5550893.1 ABC transporter permease subunit [Akkermansiaceae bacterium]
MFALPREVRTVFKREVKSYFVSPIAYVCVVIFLVISNGITFWFGGMLESGEAELYRPFFQYMPWYFIVIAPAVGMRLWSEEQRLGTMELLMTMPLAPWHAIVGKFLAASVVVFAMLVLSFPIVMVVNYLGDPDNGVILAGFVATFLTALCYLAITSAISALTRSQIVALLVSIGVCLAVWLSGLPPITDAVDNLPRWNPFWPLLKLVTTLGVLPHFNEFAKGVLGFRDIVFFLSFIAFFLFATAIAIRAKRA